MKEVTEKQNVAWRTYSFRLKGDDINIFLKNIADYRKSVGCPNSEQFKAAIRGEITDYIRNRVLNQEITPQDRNCKSCPYRAKTLDGGLVAEVRAIGKNYNQVTKALNAIANKPNVDGVQIRYLRNAVERINQYLSTIVKKEETL